MNELTALRRLVSAADGLLKHVGDKDGPTWQRVCQFDIEQLRKARDAAEAALKAREA